MPDIAAQAHDFLSIVGGVAYVVSGTSCSGPVRLFILPAPYTLRRPSSATQLTANVQTVAGIISLLNDYRISNGRPPLGFLNPWLYSYGFAGMNDITSGSNPGCGTNGFSAIVGWDPVRPPKRFSLHLYVD